MPIRNIHLGICPIARWRTGDIINELRMSINSFIGGPVVFVSIQESTYSTARTLG